MPSAAGAFQELQDAREACHMSAIAEDSRPIFAEHLTKCLHNGAFEPSGTRKIAVWSKIVALVAQILGHLGLVRDRKDHWIDCLRTSTMPQVST